MPLAAGALVAITLILASRPTASVQPAAADPEPAHQRQEADAPSSSINGWVGPSTDGGPSGVACSAEASRRGLKVDSCSARQSGEVQDAAPGGPFGAVARALRGQAR
jgi:hypothetical protein